MGSFLILASAMSESVDASDKVSSYAIFDQRALRAHTPVPQLVPSLAEAAGSDVGARNASVITTYVCLYTLYTRTCIQTDRQMG